MTDKFNSITEKGGDRYRIAAFLRSQERKKDEAALKEILSSEAGRWFIMRLFDNTFLNSTTYVGNGGWSIFNEGKRAVGVNINRKIIALGADGINARQLAEREYIDFRMRCAKNATVQEKDNEEGD